MTPLVVENEPPVTFLRRKMTGVDFRWGSLFVVTPARILLIKKNYITNFFSKKVLVDSNISCKVTHRYTHLYFVKENPDSKSR